MRHFALQLGAHATLALLTVPACLVSSRAFGQAGAAYGQGSVSGTVVDAEGIPQMGALVQLLLPDTRLAATALTDMRGHYHLSSVLPGAYRVRVSAALFLPAVRQHLVVGRNSRAVVNLTLSTMLSAGDWLPVTRRPSLEDSEDWMWTLRSSSMRPVLRLAGDESDSQTGSTSISSSAEQPRSLSTRGRLTVQDNEGSFARGGTHQVLSMVRRSGDTVTIARADVSGPRTPFPVNPSADLTIGMERRLPFAGTSRSVLSYSSHPEVQGGVGISGVQTAILRNAQRIQLGDSVRLDAGSVTRDSSLGGNSFTVEPFLQLSLRPSSGVVIAYTFTRSRGMESLEDLDRLHPAAPPVFTRNGHVQLERSTHQSLALSQRMPHRGVLQVAVFRDYVDGAALTGIGLLPALDASTLSSATDRSTATFLVAARPYDAKGVHLVWHQPVAGSVSVDGTFADGEALHAAPSSLTTLALLVDSLESKNTLSASIGASGRVQRTGTAIRGGYRWQPAGTMTAVDRFREADDTAYLNLQLRQSLRSFSLLPSGLEAVLEVQNLLEQGYQPFLSHDGHTLYLAQSPRVLQAGLSFTF